MPVIDVCDLGLKVANYKCFGAAGQGFDKILPVNVIVGRNNTGKSALLDLVSFIHQPRPLVQHSHRGNAPSVRLSHIIGEKLIRSELCVDQHGCANSRGLIRNRLSDHRLEWEFRDNRSFQVVSPTAPTMSAPEYTKSAQLLANRISNPFERFEFRRILADRDVVLESSTEPVAIAENGIGLTAAVEAYLNRNDLPSALVENAMLNDLNQIFAPDAVFQRILVQKRADLGDTPPKWEIHLDDTHNGRVGLSHTGSGIKTVLLVLANLHLIPHNRERPLSDFLFAFEELENNLHPAVQRRLFRYVRERIVREKSVLFLTTHSSVVIDLFSNDDQAQVLHVANDGAASTVTAVSNFLHGRALVEDLGVRASDLLQANAIIWLEGPSDRIYVNRWIELWSAGTLKEGAHYQCLLYGGSNIAHHAFDTPDVANDLINTLNVNGHAVVLIDSDKRKGKDPLKAHASRVKAEIETVGGVAWVTEGREVENYIPLQVHRALANDPTLVGPKRYDNVFTFMDRAKVGSFQSRKVDLARKVCATMTRPMLLETLDLSAMLETICRRIAEWNGIAWPTPVRPE